MTDHPIMACGHAAGGTNLATGAPVCVICFGKPEAEIVAEAPNLDGRIARCSYYGRRSPGGTCLSERPSATSLAFFEHKPDEDHDEFYCGCWGWD